MLWSDYNNIWNFNETGLVTERTQYFAYNPAVKTFKQKNSP